MRRTILLLATLAMLTSAGLVLVGSPTPATVHPKAWPAVSSGELVVAYPPEWTLDAEFLASSRRVSLTTFSGQYLHGGILPPGGAELQISWTAGVPTLDLSVATADAFSDLEIQEQRTVFISETRALRTRHRVTFGGRLTYDGITVHFPLRDRLYQFRLAYRAGDPRAPEFEGLFEAILTSARAVKAPR